MRDFARLREHLRIALLCAPLAAAGCAKENKQPAGKPAPAPADAATRAPVATTSDAAPATDAAPAQPAPPPAAADAGVAKPKPKPIPEPKPKPPTRGRPLFDGQRAVVAEARFGAPAPLDATAATLPDALRAKLADGWIADALAEHASIAAFARATIELMAAGAPPELLADCQRAGLDEVRHAERCFALATRYAGRTVDAGALPSLPPRAATAVQLARDTFLEGCVGETVAALVATRALAGCQDPLVARTLGGIVKDETRHAALAWRTVSWAIAQGGREVIAELRRLADERRPVADGLTSSSEPELARHGRLDAAAARAAELDAWAQVITPTLAQLLGEATQEALDA